MKNHNNPSHAALAQLWLNTYFSNKTCVVFFAPGQSPDFGSIEKILRANGSADDTSSIFFGELCILDCLGDVEKATKICSDTPATIYTTVWHGDQFVHENT